LHLLKEVLRFGQVQAERVDRQRVAVDLGNLVDSWRLVVIVVIGFDDHLHSELSCDAVHDDQGQLTIDSASVEVIDLQPALQVREPF
jgi:hypothetical protein